MSDANPETQPALPSDASGAQARIDELLAQPDFRQRVLDGNAEDRATLHSLNTIIASQATAEQTTDNQLSAHFARERGVSEEVIKHHLVDRAPITPQEHAAAVRWRQSHFQDPKWRELYFSGDLTARREAALSSILISSPVKPAA